MTGVQTGALPISCAMFDWFADHRGCGVVDNQRDAEFIANIGNFTRSEERRVGKEGRSRWAPDH